MSKQLPKIVMGIDPGFADTGYGVVEVRGNAISMLDYGSIKTNSKLEFVERLNSLHIELDQIIKTYNPTVVGIEKVFFSKNIKTGIDVAQARGVIMLTALKNNVHILECSPQDMKIAVSGYGGADKKQIQKMVQTILNLKEIPKPDDAADALAIAVWASQKRI